MKATVWLFGVCPVCGYRSRGALFGTVRPSMRWFTMLPGSIGYTPKKCDECDHPIGRGLYDRVELDEETCAALTAWRQRQRDRRAARKRGAA